MAQAGDRKSPLMPDAAEPLVLVGPPREIRGEFLVHNPTERKIIVRQPVLKSAAAPAARTKAAAAKAAKAGIAALPETVTLRRIKVRAGQSRPVPLSLTLDPRTPPGTYEAELDVDGEQRSVVVHVTEDVALALSPDEIVLPGRAGEKFEKRVVFTNEGNVPVHVKALGAVVLEDEAAHCRALRGALQDVGDTMKNLDDFAVALGRRYRALYDTIALRVQNDEITVKPGETQAIDLTITLPEKLEKRARYSGTAAISTSTLTFKVVPD
jgi:hypothetical protein